MVCLDDTDEGQYHSCDKCGSRVFLTYRSRRPLPKESLTRENAGVLDSRR